MMLTGWARPVPGRRVRARPSSSKVAMEGRFEGQFRLGGEVFFVHDLRGLDALGR
jgi:hypothetical protein